MHALEASTMLSQLYHSAELHISLGYEVRFRFLENHKLLALDHGFSLSGSQIGYLQRTFSLIRI